MCIQGSDEHQRIVKVHFDTRVVWLYAIYTMLYKAYTSVSDQPR